MSASPTNSWHESTRRGLALVLAVSLASFLLRLGYLYLFERSRLSVTEYPDETTYYLSAAAMIRDQGLAFFASERSLWNGPINPIWLAVFNSNITVIKVANLFLISVASGFVAWGVAVWWGIVASVLCAALLLLFPPLLVFGPTLLTEPLFVSLLMLSLSTLLLTRLSFRGWLIAGVLLGLATLVRPTTQILPILCLLIGVLGRLKGNFRNIAGHGLAALLVMLPVLIWNFSHFGKIGIANGFGAVLYLGNDFRRNGDEPVYSGVDFDTFEFTKPFAHLDTEGDRQLVKVAADRIRNFPIDFLTLTARKSIRYLFGSSIAYYYPFSDYGSYTTHTAGTLAKLRGLIWPLLQITSAIFALFFIFSPRGNPQLRAILGLVLAYFVALHSVTFPIPRLVLPIFPYLLVGTIGFWFSGGLRKSLVPACLSLGALVWVSYFTPKTNPRFDREKLKFYQSQVGTNLSELHDLQLSEDKYIVSGRDPYFVYQLSLPNMGRTQSVFISLDINCPSNLRRSGDAQLFWQSSEVPSFGEDRSIHFSIVTGLQSYLLTPALSPKWRGSLQELRLDLPETFQQCGTNAAPEIKIVE